VFFTQGIGIQKSADHNMLLDIEFSFCQLYRVKSAILLILFLTLSVASACYNFGQVFIGQQIYFIDGDCYARMSRVRMVLEHPGHIIRHHDFENYPDGIDSHTTAPLDWLIAAEKKSLDFGLTVFVSMSRLWILDLFAKRAPWAADTTDLAGALISPLLGLLTAIFIWFKKSGAAVSRGAAFFVRSVAGSQPRVFVRATQSSCAPDAAHGGCAWCGVDAVEKSVAQLEHRGRCGVWPGNLGFAL
jgi:hypothetical protein